MAATPQRRNSRRVVIPLYLNPGFADQAGALEPVPGLHVQPLSKERAEAGQRNLRLPFPSNCVISVDADLYEAGAKARLKPLGLYKTMELPPLKAGEVDVDPGVFAGGVPIAKWILTSLVLTKTFAFAFGPVFRFRGFHGAETDVELLKPVSYSVRPLTGVERYRLAGMPPINLSIPFDGNEFGHIVQTLESYFRPGSFRVDRMAVALTSLWSSLCTPFPDQAYVSLSMVLEALLSTQEMEITHILAERCACALSETDKPIAVYRRVKKLLVPIGVTEDGDVLAPTLGEQLLRSELVEAGENGPRRIPPDWVDDAVDETIFSLQAAVDTAEQARFERAMRQGERYLDDRLLVLRRRRQQNLEGLERAQQRRDGAMGPQARAEAEQAVIAAQLALDEDDNAIETLERRDNETFRKFEAHIQQRRYAPPRVEALFELALDIE